MKANRSASEGADDTDMARRTVTKAAGAAPHDPDAEVVILGKAWLFAATNSAINAKVRAELHYQDTPKDGMKCLTCLGNTLAGRQDGFWVAAR